MTTNSSKDKPPGELHDAFARLTMQQWVEAMRLGRGSVGLGICAALDKSIQVREAESKRYSQESEE